VELLTNVLCFVSGVVLTVGVLIAWAWYLKMQDRVSAAELSKKEMQETLDAAIEEQRVAAARALQNSLAELKSRVRQPPPQSQQQDGAASVKDRLRKAVELTAKQSKIEANKGPEHQMQHNELELEKLTVLKSILADGFDPVITIRFNTGDQEMLLSNYVQSITKGLA
jgi:hypothetical protein